MNIRYLLLIIFCTFTAEALGQFKVKMGGRLFMDAGVYTNSPKGFSASAKIADVRITSKASLGEDWKGKIDISFANNKVSLKDAFIEKSIKDNYFRVGHMFGMFSIDQANSSNDFLFMTPALVANIFGPSRRLGLSYTYAGSIYYFSAGAFMGDKLHFDKEIKQGFNATTRFVYRPYTEKRKLLHLGFGGFFRKPDHSIEVKNPELNLSTLGNTKLSSPDILAVNLPNCQKTFQWNVEAIGQFDRFFMQGEYMQMLVNRQGFSNYLAQGGYIQAGFVLKGEQQDYDMVDAFPICPTTPRSLLLFARFSITDLNHETVKGGYVKDLALGLNYYFFRYLIFRINYSYQWTDECSAVGKNNWGLLQGRVQLKF